MIKEQWVLEEKTRLLRLIKALGDKHGVYYSRTYLESGDPLCIYRAAVGRVSEDALYYTPKSSTAYRRRESKTVYDLSNVAHLKALGGVLKPYIEELPLECIHPLPEEEADVDIETDEETLELATTWNLWQDRVDPGMTMTETEFDAMTIRDKIEIIYSCFESFESWGDDNE